MKYLLIACLTLKAALDVHCRLVCLDEGEYGGQWNEKEKACECNYIRYPSLPVRGVLVKPEPKQDR